MSLFIVVQFEGRQMRQEEIQFRSNKVMSGHQADWSRAATNEHVITAVPLKTWVVMYTKRDHSKAIDFIDTMLKVAGTMGIDCSQPTRFELKDDRVETYIRALRENINPRVCTLGYLEVGFFSCHCCFIMIDLGSICLVVILIYFPVS